MYVEVKAIDDGKFSTRQVARSLHAVLEAAGDRTAALLLVLDSPPPIAVKGHGRQSIRDALELGLHAFPDDDAQRLREALDGAVAWTTWDRVARSVQRSLDVFPDTTPSVRAGIARIASSLLNAVHAQD